MMDNRAMIWRRLCLAACLLAAWSAPAVGQTGPRGDDKAVYGQLSVVHKAQDVASWPRRSLLDGPAIVSPALEAPDGYEINHHRVTVRFSGDGTVQACIAYGPSDLGAVAFDKPGQHGRWQTVKSGQEIGAVSRQTNDRFASVALRTEGNVKIEEVRQSCWRGRGTIFGHVAAVYAFDGGKLPYRLLYPRNFDPKKKYPLVLSVHGSGGVGDDNARGMENVTLARYLFTQYYFDDGLECFSLVPQIPSGSANPEAYWPSGEKGAPTRPDHPDWPAVNENGWYVQATLSLIRTLTAGKAFNIDPDRVYCTGFSYGGKAVWELLKAGPDVFAAGIAGGGWAIGPAYSEPKGELATGLAREVARYKHVPVRVFAGGKDPMRLGSSAVHKEILRQGGKSEYEEFPDTEHIPSAGKAWGNRKNVEWLFKQDRKDRQPTTMSNSEH